MKNDQPNSAPVTHNIVCAENESAVFTGAKFTDSVAYSGGTFRQWWARTPVIIDLAGMKLTAQTPLLFDHTNTVAGRVGEAVPRIENGKLVADGELTGTSVAEYIANAGKHIPWQLSVGAFELVAYELDAEATANINGREWTGPLTVITSCALREISVVAVGADKNTKMTIAAALRIDGYNDNLNNEGAGMSKQNETGIAAGADNKGNAPESITLGEQPGLTPATIGEAVNAALDKRDEQKRAADAELAAARTETITAIFGDDFPEIKAKAIAENWDAAKAREEYRIALAGSYAPPTGIQLRSGSSTANKPDIIHAGLMMTCGVSPDETVKALNENAVVAAQKSISGVSLKEAVLMYAQACGCPETIINRGNIGNVLAYCFGGTAAQASNAFSTIGLGGIFENIANKKLLESYNYHDQSWREIAAIGRTKDFKEVTSYRLSIGDRLEKLAPGGEIKHGTLSEQEYKNRVERFALMLSISDVDIINDDLGALTTIPAQLGTTAAISFNEVFWGEFMDNAGFFTAGNKNLITGADSVLSIESLSKAATAIRRLKGANDAILGLRGEILLVGAANETTAAQLHQETNVIATGVGGSRKVETAGNPHRGKYRPVVSPYLDDEAMKNSSQTAWYLLANPKIAPAIEVLFLDGVEHPRVETQIAPFHVLGWQARAIFEFGPGKTNPASGIKSTGA